MKGKNLKPKRGKKARLFFFVSYYCTDRTGEGAFGDCVVGLETAGFHIAGVREYIRMSQKADHAVILFFHEISEAEYLLTERHESEAMADAVEN
jgi:hypothetical protein